MKTVINAQEIDFNKENIIRIKDDNLGIGSSLIKESPMMICPEDICPSKGYWLRLIGTGWYIRVDKKPSKVQQFFMKKLLRVEFYEGVSDV